MQENTSQNENKPKVETPKAAAAAEKPVVAEKSPTPAKDVAAKTLSVASVAEAKGKVPDIKVVGDGDTFKVLCKVSSESEGWMKSTQYLEIQGNGVIVNISTQQRNFDGSYSLAEAAVYCPGVKVSHESGVPKLVTF